MNLIHPRKDQAGARLVKRADRTLQINPIKKTGSDTAASGERATDVADRADTGEVRTAIDVIQLSLHDGLTRISTRSATIKGVAAARGSDGGLHGVPFNLTAAGCQKSAIDRMGRDTSLGGPRRHAADKKVKWLEPSTRSMWRSGSLEKFAGIRSAPATPCDPRRAAGEAVRQTDRGPTARAAPDCMRRAALAAGADDIASCQ